MTLDDLERPKRTLAPFRMEILQAFVLLTPPLFHPKFGGVPVAPDRPWGRCEQVP